MLQHALVVIALVLLIMGSVGVSVTLSRFRRSPPPWPGLRPGILVAGLINQAVSARRPQSNVCISTQCFEESVEFPLEDS